MSDKSPKNQSSLTTQVGGSHYKDCAIQPVEYIHANNLGYCEGAVVKYVTRWKSKGGVADLEKAKHFIDLLIELEGKKARVDGRCVITEITEVIDPVTRKRYPGAWVTLGGGDGLVRPMMGGE